MSRQFPKGTIVKLTQEALDKCYGSSKACRAMAAAKRYRVVGYSRDGRCTWIGNIEGSPNSRESYYTPYLEKVAEHK